MTTDLPRDTVMDDELRMLHEAMVVKDRLKVLAELQATYWDELIARGFDQSIAEQLMLDWSRHAYGMTFRSVPDPAVDVGLDDLLGPKVEDDAPASHHSDLDPSRVPPGEPWLQLVQDCDLDDEDEPDERAA